MFKPTNIHNGKQMISLEKRLIFKANGERKQETTTQAAPNTAPETTSTPEQSQERIRQLLDEGVDITAVNYDVNEAIKALAQKLFPNNAQEKQRWTAERINAWNEALKQMSHLLTPDNKQKLNNTYNRDMKKLFEDELKKKNCKIMTLEERNSKVFFRFFTESKKEIVTWPPNGVAINTNPTLRGQTSETTDDQQAALQLLKQQFPRLKVAVGPTAVGEGSVAHIPSTRELDIYTDTGKQTISTDTLGEFTQSDCRITKPYTITLQARNRNETRSTEMVYIETTITGMRGSEKYEGWVVRSRLSDVDIKPPEAKISITINQQKVAKEEQKRQQAEEAKRARNTYLDDKGIVHFQDKEKRKTTLKDLFPNAHEGDQVQVTHKIGGTIEHATYKNNDWLNDQGKHVPIYDGDTVILTSDVGNEHQLTSEPQPPALPPELKLLDPRPRKLTPEEAKTKTWNDIAKELIQTNDQIRNTGITHVEYAELLKKYATDTGYYWVIIPPVQPKPEEEAKKAIAAAQTEAAARDRESANTAQRRDIAAYQQYANILWQNKTIRIEGDQFNEYINDETKWNEAWNNNYPINSRLIMEAFKRPPYKNLPETMIRDGVRKMLYAPIGQNRFDFSDMFKYFNKNGEIYKNLDEKPGSLNELREEYQLVNETVPNKVQQNREAGKALNAGFSEDEQKVFQKYWSYADRADELRDVLMGAAVIVDAIAHALRHPTEAPQWMRAVPEYRVSERDQQFGEAYRNTIWRDEGIKANDSMNEILKDEQKWDDFWEHNKGNVLILKRALQRPPFNKLQGAEKTLIRKALDPSYVSHYLTMSDLLDDLNPNGLIYKNRKGQKGDLDDFKKEYWEEQVGYKIKHGQQVTPEEKQMYDNHPNKETLGNRYNELAELFVSSSYVLDAVKNLDPNSSYSESVPPAERPQAMLDEAFPPTDAGSINGVPQNYYDTYGDNGSTRVAGGGLFTGGLFKYDFRDRYKGISDFDQITSNATANRIILDQCQTNGKLDSNKLQTRLNQLLLLGVTTMLAEPDSPQKKQALQALGITDKELASNISPATISERMAINLNAGKPLTPAQKDMIRLGFMIETVAHPGEVGEVKGEIIKWSDDPKVRELQEMAYKLGATPEDVSQMDEQIIAFIHGVLEKNFRAVQEAGLTVPIELTSKGSNKVYLALNGAYDSTAKKFIFRAGVGGETKVAENWSLVGGVGATTDGRFIAGAGVNWEIPVDEKTVWQPNMIIGAGISTDFKGVDTTIGTALMWIRSNKKQLEADFMENLEKSGYKAVEEAQNIPAKAAALRNLPGPSGTAFRQLQSYLALDDEGLVNIYERYFKEKIKQSTAQAGLSEHKFLGFLPPVVKAGVGLGLQLSTDGSVTVLPGVACAISIGSELIVFQRPVTSTAAMVASGDERMKNQAEERIRKQEQFKSLAQQAGYKNITFAETLVGDMESGMRPVKQERATVSSRPTLNPVEEELDKVFQDFQKALLEKGIQLKKSGNFYHMRILNVGNYQVYVDPQMKERIGVFVKDGEIYISASKNPKMVIKRLDQYFPRPKDGNIKHTIITISDNDFRTVSDIMAESDFFLDSRTKDNTGTERTKLALNYVGGHRQIKQYNLRNWNDAEYKKGLYNRWFDNLNTTTPDMAKYREFLAQQQKYAGLAKEVRNNIGSADLESVNIYTMHGFAMDFMKKHPIIYRRYTTYQVKSEPEILRLNETIKKDFKAANKRDITDDELTVVKEELFNLSMSEAEKKIANLPENKKLEAKRELLRNKINWMRDAIYVPFFRKYAVSKYNPNHYTPEQLAEAFIAPLRQMAINGNFDNAEDIPVGAHLDVAVGTESIVGRRGITAGRPDQIANHKLFAAHDYSEALVTHYPPIDYTIALCFRESQRPLEMVEPNQFLASPMAIKLMLLGTEKGNPILIKALGEENYKLIAECYKTKPPTIPKNADIINTKTAINELYYLAIKLSDAQTGQGTKILVKDKNGNNQEYYSITVKDLIIGIRTTSHKSGVYERCLNAAELYDEEIIALDKNESYTMESNFRAYDAKTANSLVSSFAVRDIAIGAGVVGPVGPSAPEQNSAPPPTKTQPQPQPAPGTNLSGGDTTGHATPANPAVESGGASE